MTNEERDIIAAFIARVGGGGAAPPSAWGGASVPATQPPRPDLPPIDPDADRFLAQQFQAYPEARYRITQLALVQEQALVEAQNRLRRMEWELQQARQTAQQATQQQAGQRAGGFFSNLFGGGGRPGPGATPVGPGAGPWGQGAAPAQGQAPYAPPPQYPPGYQAGMFQRGGSGFLGSALTTAAGVAGGMLAADALRDMFSPHQGGSLAAASAELAAAARRRGRAMWIRARGRTRTPAPRPTRAMLIRAPGIRETPGIRAARTSPAGAIRVRRRTIPVAAAGIRVVVAIGVAGAAARTTR